MLSHKRLQLVPLLSFLVFSLACKRSSAQATCVGVNGTSPANFQLVETSSGVFAPFACPEYGACLRDNACYEYNEGKLCHQCTKEYSGRGTRQRAGEVCNDCPNEWWFWLRLILFYAATIALLSCLTSLQYKATRAPLFTVARLAEAKRKERAYFDRKQAKLFKEAAAKGEDPPPEAFEAEVRAEPNVNWPLPAKTSPVLIVALARAAIEHHVLCGISWDYSGFILLWPASARWMTALINMELWNFISMGCISREFFVADMLHFAVVSIPLHVLIWIVVLKKAFSGRAFKGGFGSHEIILKDKETVERAFDVIDVNVDGKLTKAEVLKHLLDDKVKQRLPGTGWMIVAAACLLQLYQVPLFSQSFLYNLDCVEIAGKNWMRIDLTQECAGDPYRFRYTMSIIGIIFYGFGSAFGTLACIFLARRNSVGEDAKDNESAFAFLQAGLNPSCWWFGGYKMFLKELLPVILLISRDGTAATDPGVSNAPVLLVIIGFTCYVNHNYWQPFDFQYEQQLSMIERISWLAFAAAPIATMAVGQITEVAHDTSGNIVIGKWTKEASTFFDWILLMSTWWLYYSVYIYAVFCVFDDQYGMTKLQTINMEVNERVRLLVPEKKRHRKLLIYNLAKLFEEAMLSATRNGEFGEEGLSLAPSSCLEAALLEVMREDAAYYGDVDAGSRSVLNVELESFEATISLLQRDRSTIVMAQLHTILDAGADARKCLLTSDLTLINLDEEKKEDEDEAVDEGDGAWSPKKNPDVDGNPVTNQVIMLNFALEKVELRSLGLKEGEARRTQKARPAVLKAMTRALAAASAAPETDIDLKLLPTGLDKVLVTVNVFATTDNDLTTREDWLRSSLGTKESRNRWAKSMESDLARVGVISSSGGRLVLRFNKTSKPQRATEEVALAIARAAATAASDNPDEIPYVRNAPNASNDAGGLPDSPSPTALGNPVVGKDGTGSDDETRSSRLSPAQDLRAGSLSRSLSKKGSKDVGNGEVDEAEHSTGTRLSSVQDARPASLSRSPIKKTRGSTRPFVDGIYEDDDSKGSRLFPVQDARSASLSRSPSKKASSSTRPLVDGIDEDDDSKGSRHSPVQDPRPVSLSRSLSKKASPSSNHASWGNRDPTNGGSDEDDETTDIRLSPAQDPRPASVSKSPTRGKVSGSSRQSSPRPAGGVSASSRKGSGASVKLRRASGGSAGSATGAGPAAPIPSRSGSSAGSRAGAPRGRAF